LSFSHLITWSILTVRGLADRTFSNPNPNPNPFSTQKDMYALKLDNTDNGDLIKNGLNRPAVKRRSIRRRCSLFYVEQELRDADDFDNIWNQDAFDGTITDLSNDRLNPFGNSGEVFEVKDRTLSLTMNFDINRYSYNVGGRRASIAIAKLSSEELDTMSNIVQPITFYPTTENLSESHMGRQLSPTPPTFFSEAFALKDRTLSLTMNFDINRYSYNVGDRRASIAIAKLTSEELEGKQLSPTPPPFFSDNIAGYYSMLQNNLLEATEKSRVTRVALTKMNENMIKKRTVQQTKYAKKKVIKRPQPSKYLRKRSVATQVVIAQPTNSYPTENLHELQKGEQLSPTLPSADSPPFFSGDLAGRYSILQNNLFKAIEKSKVTRVVFTKIRENNLRKAKEKSKLTRVVLAKMKENMIKKRAAHQMKLLKRKVVKRSKPSKQLCRRYL